MRRLALSIVLLGCGNVNDDLPRDDASPPLDSLSVPSISAIAPDWGSSAGGTRITIRGRGFATAGLEVKLGATAATTMLISDTELTLVTPSGPIAPVDVVVKTDGGASAASRFRYLAPLYAADGRGGTLGNLYTVDPTTALATIVGPLAFGVTGLAISPDGELFGSTTGRGPVAAVMTLIRIDPYSGAATPIGTLKTAENVTAGAADIAFVGTKLYGWSKQALTSIDTATGLVTLSPGTLGAVSQGSGLASLNGTMYLSPERGNGRLFTVNLTTGAATPTVTLQAADQAVSAMTFVGTTLFGSSAIPGSTPNVALMSFNPLSGARITVGNFRSSTASYSGIDAIAGIPAQP